MKKITMIKYICVLSLITACTKKNATELLADATQDSQDQSSGDSGGGDSGGAAVSFNGSGYNSVDFASDYSGALASAIQSDGKIVAVGYGYHSASSNAEDLGVARFNADGTLDEDFASYGVFNYSFGTYGNSTFTDQATSVKINANGKIVVAGFYSINSTNQAISVLQLNADGTLDSNFGTAGVFTLDPTSGSDRINSMAISATGKIILAGQSTATGNNDLLLVQLNADGTLDTNFATQGVYSSDLGSNNDIITSVVSAADNFIYLGGYTGSSNINGFLMRLTAAGAVDGTWASPAPIDNSGQNDFIKSIAVNGSSIVFAGFTQDGAGNTKFLIGKTSLTGSLDNQFGTNGLIVPTIGNCNCDMDYADQATSVMFDANNKIVVAGFAYNSGYAKFAVTRYSSLGVLDSSYANQGIFMGCNEANQNCLMTSAFMQPDGKIVFAGNYSETIHTHVILGRLTANGNLDISTDE